MGFVSSVVKILIRNWLGNGASSSGPKNSAKRPCRGCGRPIVDKIGDGICATCRSAHEQQKERTRWGGKGPHPGPETNGLKAAYQFLGCTPGDSDAVIKRKFRELAKQCHPDQLHDLPPHKVSEANGLFRDLRDAYDVIMESRKAS